MIFTNPYNIYEGVTGDGMKCRILATNIKDATEESCGGTVELVKKLNDMELK